MRGIRRATAGVMVAAGALALGAATAQASTFGAITDPAAGLRGSYSPEVSAAAAARSFPKGTKTYGGHTTVDGAPVVIRATSKRALAGSVLVYPTCQSGKPFPAGFSFVAGRRDGPKVTGGRLSRSGAFKMHAVGDQDLLAGQVATFEVDLGGKLGARRSKGTISLHLVVRDKASGQTTDVCDSGVVAWVAAVPERRVYAGVTKQLYPVVLELSRSRASVQAFWFGIAAKCTPDGGIIPSDVVERFPIRHGRFGSAFSDEAPADGGGKVHVDYALQGKVGRAKASGTIAITVTTTDAGGAQTSRCASGKVAWLALQ